MSLSLSNRYHHSRWSLVKNTTTCVFWLVVGAGILFFPIGKIRWVGLMPVGYGLLRWSFSIRPRWKHVVILDEEKLVIGKRSYDWSQFDEMRLERNESARAVNLIGDGGNLDVLIKDDLPDFDKLAQNCFFHMNRSFGQPNSLNSLPESGSFSPDSKIKRRINPEREKRN